MLSSSTAAVTSLMKLPSSIQDIALADDKQEENILLVHSDQIPAVINAAVDNNYAQTCKVKLSSFAYRGNDQDYELGTLNWASGKFFMFATVNNLLIDILKQSSGSIDGLDLGCGLGNVVAAMNRHPRINWVDKDI